MCVAGCSQTPDEAARPRKSAADTPAQILDSTYLDNKYSSSANAHCGVEADDYLRSIAKYDFAWDEDAKGFLGTKFDKYLNYVTAPGVITLLSSKAKLQNGFGAYEHLSLYCNFDTQSDKVLSFSIEQPLPMTTEPAAPATSSPSTPPPTSTSSAPPSVAVAAPPSPASDTGRPSSGEQAGPPSEELGDIHNGVDCARPMTGAASMICNSASLEGQNSQISSIYRTLVDRADVAKRSQFIDEQRAWLSARDACKSYACLGASYQQRLHAVTLEAWDQYNSQRVGAPAH
jgi:uncharacterized protein YecT (DUF1311 family)